MNFEEAYEDLLATEKTTFQKSMRTLLKHTFIVCDKNEESRKLYFFVRKNEQMISDYLGYMGFELMVDSDNKVIMLRNRREEGIVSNRLRLRKYDSIVLCCLWIMYMEQLREGNLTRSIRVTLFELRQTMEKFGIKGQMEGKGILKEALKLFTFYQLVEVNGEIGNPECQIRLYASLQFALDTEEFKRLVTESEERMQKKQKGENLLEEDEGEEDDDAA